jgi:hypothetical protein
LPDTTFTLLSGWVKNGKNRYLSKFDVNNLIRSQTPFQQSWMPTNCIICSLSDCIKQSQHVVAISYHWPEYHISMTWGRQCQLTCIWHWMYIYIHLYYQMHNSKPFYIYDKTDEHCIIMFRDSEYFICLIWHWLTACIKLGMAWPWHQMSQTEEEGSVTLYKYCTP